MSFFSGQLGTPDAVGKLRNPEKFDNIFFGIHRQMADSLDALTRLSLERSVEAIIDAGNLLHSIPVYFNLFITCLYLQNCLIFKE